jgi:hypothetical protein
MLCRSVQFTDLVRCVKGQPNVVRGDASEGMVIIERAVIKTGRMPRRWRALTNSPTTSALRRTARNRILGILTRQPQAEAVDVCDGEHVSTAYISYPHRALPVSIDQHPAGRDSTRMRAFCRQTTPPIVCADAEVQEHAVAERLPLLQFGNR